MTDDGILLEDNLNEWWHNRTYPKKLDLYLEVTDKHLCYYKPEFKKCGGCIHTRGCLSKEDD